jgi:hypothetical protein
VLCHNEEGKALDGRDQTVVSGGCLLSLSVCRRGFQDLCKVGPYYLSRDDHNK